MLARSDADFGWQLQVISAQDLLAYAARGFARLSIVFPLQVVSGFSREGPHKITAVIESRR